MLVLILIAISSVIYYPFFKAYEKQLLLQENPQQQEEKPTLTQPLACRH
ncbi:hypothetical protein ACMV8I_00130 [Ewingella sp. S1.OA.A_B6]